MKHISVQAVDFDQGEEYRRLRDISAMKGAIVTFTGLVRDYPDGSLEALELEHYPAMTEKSLTEIVDEACERWPLTGVSVIHRYGKLSVSEQIVFVGVASLHRDAAFEAARFVMDVLKTSAPFWKKEYTRTGNHWVEAKEEDQQQANRWRDG